MVAHGTSNRESRVLIASMVLLSATANAGLAQNHPGPVHQPLISVSPHVGVGTWTGEDLPSSVLYGALLETEVRPALLVGLRAWRSNLDVACLTEPTGRCPQHPWSLGIAVRFRPAIAHQVALRPYLRTGVGLLARERTRGAVQLGGGIDVSLVGPLGLFGDLGFERAFGGGASFLSAGFGVRVGLID